MYELVDTASGSVEAIQEMTADEAARRNAALRASGDSLRWIPAQEPESPWTAPAVL